ncbi:MAG: type II toxin-antitoxin system RelE/ParE family toxin [bacterium]
MTVYKIEYTNKSIKNLKKLDIKAKTDIIKAIENIPNGDIKAMKGYSDGRKRLRVGKYRVIYSIDNTNKLQILLVIDVGSRGDIYKRY